MIAAGKFVFIHMHKTGGQTLGDVIRAGIAGSREIGYHYPRSAVPPELEALPVVGMVRNPWDWYVSWYAFNRRPQINNPLFNVVSDSGAADFRTTVTNLVNLGADSAASRLYRNDLVRMLPDTLEGNRGAGLTKDSIREFASDDTGYYSWLFERMLGAADDGRTHIGRFERLEDDFLEIMQRLGVEEAGGLRQAFAAGERRNTSRHTHYSHYYDDELRDLIAGKEAALIAKYGYEFASLKPPGAAYEFPADTYTGTGFRKLLGRESNYLQLHHDFDVEPLRRKIAALPAEAWLGSERERLFAVHKDTQSLLLVLFEDFKHEKPEYLDAYADFAPELAPLIERVAGYYRDNGFVIRLLLAKLRAGGRIPHHTDAGYSLLNCHRVHIPVITSDDVVFSVGGEEKVLRPGEFWEINNSVDHAVENRGAEDRVHIIIDWMPNHAGRPVEEVVRSPDAAGPPGGGVPQETLEAMIAQAYQVHQSGEAARAESLYRQVLHLDADNVVANNLFGLLCLQTRRAGEAEYHIRKALAVSPDDAQAHSNLGIALKDLSRPEEAAEEFHKSLKLVPTNARVYNNLGGVYVTLRRVDDAITCFRQALAIQPAFAEALYNLGNALMMKHHYAEAVECLKQCVLHKPDFAEAQTRLVQALKGQQNQDAASRAGH